MLLIAFGLVLSIGLATTGTSAQTSEGDLRVESHFSSIAAARNTVGVWLPPGYTVTDQPYPVLYLLAGSEGRWGNFLRASHATDHALRLVNEGEIRAPILVMPNWANTAAFEEYSTYLAEELVPFIDATFHTKANRSGRGIGGWSRGGIVALIASMMYPETFSGAAGIATESSPNGFFLFHEYLGAHRQYRHRLAFWLQWGTADLYVERPLPLLDTMERFRFPHEYLETTGGHRESLANNTDKAIVFLMKQMEHADEATLSVAARSERFVLPAGQASPTLDVRVRLRSPLPPAESLLLGPLGDNGPVRLSSPGDGNYSVGYQLAEGLDNGIHWLPLIHRDERAGDRYMTGIRLEVYPTQDLLVIDRQPLWAMESNSGVTPVPASFEGRNALSLTGTRSWRISLIPDQPVSVFGYSHLAFEFHPADFSLREGRTPQLRVLTQAGRLVELIGRLDLERQEWQSVTVGIDELGLGATVPLEELRFTGNVEGNFFLADARLVAQAMPGSPDPTAVLETLQSSRPTSISLSQNYPNPFNPETTIRFDLPAFAEVDLSLYNLAGQRVATLARGPREAGVYTLRWDGTDDAGYQLASGLYLYRLTAGAETTTRRLMLLR